MKRMLNYCLVMLVVVGLVAFIAAGARQGQVAAQGPSLESVILPAVDDAYVITDASTADDPQGLRDRNFGTQDAMLVSFANKVQKDEQVVTVALVKFDLTPIKDKQVQSATLQLFGLRVDLAQQARLVDATLVNGLWSEKDVTFNKRPQWGADALAVAAVYGAGIWYSWDVTAGVLQRTKDGQVSFVLGLRAAEEKKIEQLVFAAHEAGQIGPRLIVVTTASESEGVPWWTWAAGIGGAALVAFFVGWRLAVRRRSAAHTSHPSS